MRKTKYFIILIYLALCSLFLLRYFKHNPQPQIHILNTPVLAVTYNPEVVLKNASAEVREQEKNSILKTASEITALQWPEQKKLLIDANGSLTRFADYNLTITSNHETFFSIAAIPNNPSHIIDPNNSIAELLDDRNFEKYAAISGGQDYDIFLELNSNPGYTPQEVIINGQRYPITRAGRFYKLTDFQSKSVSAVGLKSANNNYSIKSAVLASSRGGSFDLNRLYSGDYRIMGKQVSFNLPDNSYILLDNLGLSFNNNQVLPKPFSLIYYNYQVLGEDSPRIDLRAVNSSTFISSSGSYLVRNDSYTLKGLIYFRYLFLGLLILLAVLNWKFILKQLRAGTAFSRVTIYQPLINSLVEEKNSVLFILFIMIILLSIRANLALSRVITPSILFAVMIFGSVVIAKFSLRYLASLAFILIFLMAVLVQLEQLNYAEKTGLGTLLIVCLYLLTIFFQTLLKSSKSKRT